MDTLLAIASVRSVLLLTIIPLTAYYIIAWMFRSPRKNYPPGPRGWTTNLKLLKASWNGTLPMLAAEWAKVYGSLTFVYSLGKPVLFLNTAEVTRQLLSSDKYKYLVADRSLIAASRIAKFHGKDLVFTKFDAISRKKRRMFHKMLSLYGDGVERFENVVWAEMERMFTEIDSSHGQDIVITKSLVKSLKIIIFILAIGERPADPTIPDILEEYDFALNDLTRPDVDFVLNYLPFVAHLPGKFKKAVNRVITAKKKADELVYYGPKRTYVEGRARGITDLLIDQQKMPGYEWLEHDEEHILAFLATLFLTAHLTSRASLIGTFLCLLNYPEVTKRIVEEIDTVIGDKRPRIEHRAAMPYTEACVLEGLRVIGQTPLSGFRIASQDIDFEGMIIPKDTLIFMNNWFYLHDETVWKDPWRFKPERFLDSEGQLLPADHPTRKDMVAFGVGLRACPGEVFARSRVFLFITSLLQRYELLPPTSEKLLPADFTVHDENVYGLIRQTPAYKCRFVRRQLADK